MLADTYQAVEAVSAAVVPLAAAVGAGIRWRSNAQKEKKAREEAARVAAEAASKAARDEVREINNQLLSDKDRQIKQGREDLASERAENALKDAQISQLQHQLQQLLQPPHNGSTA